MRNFHNSQLTEYREPYGAATCGSTVRLRLESDADSARLRIWHDEQGETVFLMQKFDGYFEYELILPDEPCILWYFFLLDYPGKTLCYGNNKKELGGIGELYEVNEAESYQITVYEDFEIPEWYKNSVVYQIFPDRFKRGEDPDADTAGRKLENWDTLPYYIKDKDGHVLEWNFWAGNLAGITEKLDMLEKLGIGCIYLNPIFKARSNHRYDTADYSLIDPLLGSEKSFRLLCKEAQKRGIRIILDGVFSHTGIDSIYYRENPDWYTGAFWWGVKDLPEVNELHPEFMKYICGKDGILRKWLRLGASGWRLDVADELPDEFIEAVRECIKDENPDALLIGEVWEDASNKVSYGKRRKFLGGKQLDAAMNYPLRSDILDFIGERIDAWEFAERQRSREENYPKEAHYGAFNLIGSHDRERILSLTGGDKKKMQMAVLLTFVLPGVPVIYYGDEAGLEGGVDPDNRRSYPWGLEDPVLIKFYKDICGFYHAHESLKSGSMRIFAVGPDDLIVERRTGRDVVEIYLNRKTKSCELTDKKIKNIIENIIC